MDYVILTEELMNVQNSCKISGDVIGQERMIRLELQVDKVTVAYGNKNSDVTTPCFSI